MRKTTIAIGALFASSLAFGQVRIEDPYPTQAPGSAQRNHPMYVDAPAFLIVELNADETRRHYLRMYLNEVAENKVTSKTIHWPEGESAVPMEEAVQFWDFYSQLMSDISNYIREQAAQTCSMDSVSPAALRSWAERLNARDENILMFYDQVIDKVESGISPELARRLEWGVTGLINSHTTPVEKWVVDVTANDADLLQAYNRVCHPQPPKF